MVIMATDAPLSTSPPPANHDGSSTVTLRMIMQGKEVGSIIGKKGDNVKKYREESGAKINISDSSCPERIVTVTGSTDGIYKAFTMICKKFEEDIQASPNSGVPKPPVTVRLIIPASQCGSLIGKGGSKIKEIRETTGALIQVASEMLPNSTERTVTISGSADAITQCIYHICCVMQESPPKGATIPYRPKPAVAPVLIAGGQAFSVPGQYAIPTPDQPNYARAPVYPYGAPQESDVQFLSFLNTQQQISKMTPLQGGIIPQGAIPFISTQQGLIPAGMPHPALPGQFPRQPTPAGTTQAHEMTIPNDLIGCIIGRGGAKINEIRQLSGANIKIANVEEGSTDRKVTIMGTPETISAAQYLINASIEMHKTLTLDSCPLTSPAPLPAGQPPSLAVPITQFPMKPPQLAVPTSMASLVSTAPSAQGAAMPLLGLTMGMGLPQTAQLGAVEVAGANRKPLHTPTTNATKLVAAAATIPQHMTRERQRFAPY